MSAKVGLSPPNESNASAIMECLPWRMLKSCDKSAMHIITKCDAHWRLRLTKGDSSWPRTVRISVRDAHQYKAHQTQLVILIDSRMASQRTDYLHSIGLTRPGLGIPYLFEFVCWLKKAGTSFGIVTVQIWLKMLCAVYWNVNAKSASLGDLLWWSRLTFCPQYTLSSQLFTLASPSLQIQTYTLLRKADYGYTTVRSHNTTLLAPMAISILRTLPCCSAHSSYTTDVSYCLEETPKIKQTLARGTFEPSGFGAAA